MKKHYGEHFGQVKPTNQGSSASGLQLNPHDVHPVISNPISGISRLTSGRLRATIHIPG
jgi:hypothetical protein